MCRFRQKTDQDVDYISILGNGRGCRSYVGRRGGKQEVNLATGICFKRVGIAIHELMHVLGFTHEQNRIERDDYITVEWDNIQEGTQYL